MSDAKLEAQKLWNEHPCGTGPYLFELEYGSLEYFEEVRRNRYERTDEWMKMIIDFGIARNKKLLEIGCGMGTDLLTFREAGAEVYGIDIAEEHYKLARMNFELHGLDGTIKLCDCSEIDFPSSFFDFVYSHGVLHHTRETVQCVSEAYRVLVPGGRLILSLYHTYSAYHIFTMLLYKGLLRRELWKLGYRGLMSTVENKADGINIKPLVKTYTRAKLRAILKDFSKVEFKIAHFKREQIPGVGKLLPRFMERILEPYLGWYLVAFATK